MEKRYIEKHILKDLEDKVVLLAGPRQCGKTTFSKGLFDQFDYLNYDEITQRETILRKEWDRETDIVILDELHKLHEWKRFLKGVYDVDGIPPKLLVTGSAKLDVFRKVGDSLAGRYFKHRLHPFDLKELKGIGITATIEELLTTSGFPEPFLKGSETFYKRWKKTHLDIILKHDLLDLSSIRYISDLETLIQLLRNRVGSTVSYSSLARDLQYSPQTIQNWLTLLENLFIIFKITPYSKSISRSILKEPKYYFYDTAFVLGDDGSKLENLVACALLKECQFLEDTKGIDYKFHYLRNKEGKEVDFCIQIDQNPFTLIEVKWSDTNFSPHLSYFKKYFKDPTCIQLTHKTTNQKSTVDNLKLYSATNYLSSLKLG